MAIKLGTTSATLKLGAQLLPINAGSSQVQSTNALLTDLVAFWKLSNANDSSGNGRTLTPTNITYDTGKIGNAAVFNGSAYLSTTELPSLASSMTLTLWFKITGVDDEDYLVGCGDADGAFLVTSSLGDIKGRATGTGEISAGGSNAQDGNWHFAALRRTGTTAKIWIDTTSNSASGTYSAIATPSPFVIGANWNAEYLLLNGNVDAVGLWSRALSDAEIAQMYASGAGLELP